jgi:hypothetical protein|tara:strand:- start:320 stop:730 length:411 start_codon:yes stop_codon:yes gene_type:complete
MKRTELKSYIKEEIISILSEQDKISPEDVKNAEEYKGHLEDIEKLQSKIQKEDVDEDELDKDASKKAKRGKGKFKKLDQAVKELNNLKKEMISLAKEYGKTNDESRKEEIKNILREKTPIKKELESLISRLEKDAI